MKNCYTCGKSQRDALTLFKIDGVEYSCWNCLTTAQQKHFSTTVLRALADTARSCGLTLAEDLEAFRPVEYCQWYKPAEAPKDAKLKYLGGSGERLAWCTTCVSEPGFYEYVDTNGGDYMRRYPELVMVLPPKAEFYRCGANAEPPFPESLV